MSDVPVRIPVEGAQQTQALAFEVHLLEYLLAPAWTKMKLTICDARSSLALQHNLTSLFSPFQQRMAHQVICTALAQTKDYANQHGRCINQASPGKIWKAWLHVNAVWSKRIPV